MSWSSGQLAAHFLSLRHCFAATFRRQCLHCTGALVICTRPIPVGCAFTESLHLHIANRWLRSLRSYNLSLGGRRILQRLRNTYSSTDPAFLKHGQTLSQLSRVYCCADVLPFFLGCTITSTMPEHSSPRASRSAPSHDATCTLRQGRNPYKV